MTQNAISKELNFKLSWEGMLSDSLSLATIKFLNFMSLYSESLQHPPLPVLSASWCPCFICDWIYENRPYRHKK